MIQKLLLVRKVNSRADLLDEAGVRSFAAGDPLKVTTKAWSDEHGISHYGFVLKGLDLDAFEKLEEFVNTGEGLTLLDHEGDVAATLASVGLRINESAK